MITPLVSFSHCVVCPSTMYGLWLLLWYLLAIVSSVLLQCTDYDYSFGIIWPLCCLSNNVRIMITPLVSFGYCVVCSSTMYGLWLLLWYMLAIVLSVLLQCTDYDYFFGIFWLLCCLFFYNARIMITPLVSFGYCVFCPSTMYGLWLRLWYLQTLLTFLIVKCCTIHIVSSISTPAFRISRIKQSKPNKDGNSFWC
jgi:hypothetical protein